MGFSLRCKFNVGVKSHSYLTDDQFEGMVNKGIAGFRRAFLHYLLKTLFKLRIEVLIFRVIVQLLRIRILSRLYYVLFVNHSQLG